MPIIIPANSAISGGFDVTNSLMFNKADSAYLSRAQGTATGATKYTLSMWIKRCATGAEMNLIGVSSGNTIELIKFTAADKLEWYNRDAASNAATSATSNVFRDLSSWYHLVFVYDSTQGAAANQRKLYINGVNQTWASAAAIQSNAVPGLNLSGATINIGAEYSPSYYYGGNMCEVNFIDGLALTADSFGEFDDDSGIWKPIDASALTFGNNGFYLDFKDSANLGNDASGGTDFSENNIVATDQGLDTCTNNFAVNNKLSNIASRWTFTNGNNTIQHANSTSWTAMISSIAPSVGKYYMETKITGGASRTMFGVMSADTNIIGYQTNLTTICLYYNLSGGEFQQSGSTTSGNNYGTLSDGDTAGIAVDCANNKIAIYKNGSALVTNHTIPTTVDGAIGFGFTSDSNSTVYQCNYGSPYYTISSGNADANGHGNFEYTVPTGYFALCTKNLAEYG